MNRFIDYVVDADLPVKGEFVKLVIPNREIRAVWQDSFIDRFERCHSDSAETVRNFWIKHANKL